jgi:hypothetical protein
MSIVPSELVEPHERTPVLLFPGELFDQRGRALFREAPRREP